MNLCEEKIFKQTFERWQLSLQQYIQARGFERDIAANITQDAFVRLWKNCTSVNASTVKAYLYKICSNLMIDQHRSWNVRLKYRGELPKQQNTVDPHYELEMTEFKDESYRKTHVKSIALPQ